MGLFYWPGKVVGDVGRRISGKTREENARIDIRILTAKIRWSLARFDETGSYAWLDQIRQATRSYDRLWHELEDRIPHDDLGEWFGERPPGSNGCDVPDGRGPGGGLGGYASGW